MNERWINIPTIAGYKINLSLINPVTLMTTKTEMNHNVLDLIFYIHT